MVRHTPIPAQPARKTGPAINDDIGAPVVLLIDQNGEKKGHTPLGDALAEAREAGLDLVEVAPDASPPVVKILDYGKRRFDERKKRSASKRKQRTADVKEIKMRPNINVHDYNVKARAMQRFIEDGDKVKVTLRFRGREVVHQDLGIELLTRVRTQFAESVRIEQEPLLDGRLMVMVMTPR